MPAVRITSPVGLSVDRYLLAATTVGNYALFGGGDTPNDTVDAYNSSLTRSTPTVLSAARYLLAATTVGNYALFGGGRNNEGSPVSGGYSVNRTKNTVDAYDSSLTRSTPTVLSVARTSLAATTVGNYALFGGGQSMAYKKLSSGRGYKFENSSVVDAYNSSLTRSTPTVLSVARTSLAATTVGNYALFGGGNAYNDTVDAYDSSLTRSTPTVLSAARASLAATTVGNYALFGGGNPTNAVDAYDSSLTRSIPTVLRVARYYLAATTVGNYALFGGGYTFTSDATDAVDAYDSSLTHSTSPVLSMPAYRIAATTVGDYALFGGNGIVDAYMVKPFLIKQISKIFMPIFG